MDSDLAVQAPFPHRAYRSASKALLSALKTGQSLILKGAEGCGKTTLVRALLVQRQTRENGSVYIDYPIRSVNALLQQLSPCLQSVADPDHLDQVQAISGGCLIVFDQLAWQSAPEVHHALRQLCHDNRDSGLQLLFVRRDYLNLPLAGQNHDEPDYWISTEIELGPLQSDELSAYLAYLAARNGLTPPQLAMGADLQLANISNLRIARLEALLEPLLTEEVISPEVFTPDSVQPLPVELEQRFPVITTAATLFSCSALALYLIFSPEAAEEPAQEEDSPIFAEEPVPGSPAAQAVKVALPQLSQIPGGEPTPAPEPGTGLTDSKRPSALPSYRADDLQLISPVDLSPQLQPAAEDAFSLTEEESISFSVEETDDARPLEAEALAELIEPSVTRWISAWQNQDVDNYTAAYTDNFQGEYATREEWLVKRKWSLIRAEWIELKRTEFFNLRGNRSEVQVEFWLTYSASSGYRDKTHKQLTLQNSHGHWKISEENNIELIRLD
ncbi:L,D-transpeptidase Cds6 family protein [Neptuniibacter halophilus]|uniref:L,D-transpeptidase Cds6 family protein n=1 Tax=Neptuniibacter halophilus TaxID=651666 RepID=UPI002573711B|nr:hypothetical protein [Neptuniibacter halophilus]